MKEKLPKCYCGNHGKFTRVARRTKRSAKMEPGSRGHFRRFRQNTQCNRPRPASSRQLTPVADANVEGDCDQSPGGGSSARDEQGHHEDGGRCQDGVASCVPPLALGLDGAYNQCGKVPRKLSAATSSQGRHEWLSSSAREMCSLKLPADGEGRKCFNKTATSENK